MSAYEATADPIMIENIRAGDIDGYSEGGRWFFDPETVRPAQESSVEPGKSELESYLNASDRAWLKNPNGRLQYFGWAWLLNIADRALTAAFDHPAASWGSGWVLVMLLVLGVYVFNFTIIRKREIDLTRAFRMTWRSWFFVIGSSMILILSFLGELAGASANMTSGSMVLVALLFLMPAHLSLLFQSGYLSAGAKRRKTLKRNS